jgi:Rap1a immunity proteins
MRVLLGAASLLFTTAVFADDGAGISAEYPLNTGNGLLAACTYQGTEQSEIEYHFGTCVGFIKGVINGVETVRLIEGQKPLYCARPDIDNGQIRDVVVKALKENPEGRDGASAPIVMGAMYKAFKCDKAN